MRRKEHLLLPSGVQVLVPHISHVVSVDTMVCLHVPLPCGMKVLVPHSGRSIGVPGKGGGLGFHSAWAGGGRGGTTVFSVVFEMKPLLSKHFLSGQVAPFLVLCLERAGFSRDFSVLAGISGLSTSPSPHLEYLRQKDSPGNSLPCCWVVSSLARLLISLHLVFSLLTCIFQIMSEFLVTYWAGVIGKSTSSPSFWK